jgi:hypothetical protein
MSKGWQRVEFEEVNVVYKFEPHSPVKTSVFPWMYCKKCGLLYLRNSLTAWCIDKGCDFGYHSDYKHKSKTLGRINAKV